ncbi:uncharacterized protein LOC130666438 isoform X2 [Microplitis mediator]|uniref:uncharacterized protein LOC130666438 isoform X2 n=1 Tax=Microplitis mediator TaxID=375433 RepID=UPI002555A951|nr:uncharacterized protein LOC130666438 isoform X2 [Microplitis mediator]
MKKFVDSIKIYNLPQIIKISNRLIGYEIFKKFITTLARCSQRECHPVHEVKFSCEENDREASGPSATSKSQENIDDCQIIETSQQIPHVVNYEGYKKIYVLTFELDELPAEIARELNIQSDNLDCGKYEAINQAQEIIMHIIDSVFSNLNSGDDCLSDELLSINPVSPNTASTQDNINNQLKYLYNQSRIYKLQPASRIPLLLKSQKQKFNKKSL